jgi:enoyl-[acyl-carrier protein] reductase I
MPKLLEGKRILVTGIITERSLAFSVARVALQQGARLVVTGFGRMSLVERIAKRLPEPAPVLELDVTNRDHFDSLADRVREHLDGLDGVLHAIGAAPATALGGNFMNTDWDDVSRAVHVSTYSYKALATAVLPLMAAGGALVGLTFDATVAWPVYDWMGVAKAGLESTNRYLARYLGPQQIRCNLVSAGPTRTLAERSIPGAETLENGWPQRAPLGWDPNDAEATAKACCALMSDWFPATTGEVIHVDGGFHAVGA